MSRTFLITASLVVMAGLGVYAITGPQNVQMVADVQKAMGMSSCCPLESGKATTTTPVMASTEAASCPVETGTVMASTKADSTCSMEAAACPVDAVASTDKSCSMSECSETESVAVAEATSDSCCPEKAEVTDTESVEVAKVQ